MRRKLLFLFLFFGLVTMNFSVPITPVSAEDNNNVDQYQLQQGAARFYVVNLTADADLFINCTHF